MREISYPRIHFPNACNLAEARNSIQNSCRGGRNPSTAAIATASQGPPQQEARARNQTQALEVGPQCSTAHPHRILLLAISPASLCISGRTATHHLNYQPLIAPHTLSRTLQTPISFTELGGTWHNMVAACARQSPFPVYQTWLSASNRSVILLS